MLFCLVKFFDYECYVEKFRRGTLLARKLSYFRELEEEGRGDRNEGTIAHHQADQVKVEIEGMELKGMVGQVKMSSNAILDLNVFCMSAIHDQDITYPIDPDVLHERIVRPLGYLNFGRFAVVVTDVAGFIKRVSEAAKARGYGSAGNLVEYYDPTTFNGWFDGLVEPAYRKPKEFAAQREYRFVFRTDADGPIWLEFGDIRDVTIQMNSSEITEKIRFAVKDK